eukprot:3415807-Rhodomonas_salina.1
MPQVTTISSSASWLSVAEATNQSTLSNGLAGATATTLLKFLHDKLGAEPGSSMAIAAWQARNASIPTAAPQDRAARHRYRGPLAQAPPVAPSPPPPLVVPPPPPPALVPPPVVPQPPVVPVAPQAPALRTGRIPRP